MGLARAWERRGRCVMVLAFVGVLLWQASPAWAQTAPDWAAVDRYVEAEMASDRVPGVGLAIVKDDQIVHMRGFGFDGTGGMVSPQSSFVLGSMSKSFTALAVMQLVEAGQIDLAAPVQRYLPEFRVADAAASAQITVQQVLDHTSGVPTTAPRASGTNATLTDHVRALASVELVSAPGTTHAYASPNYQVLGAIVEQVSGQSFAAYVEQHIFAPLGMTHSFTSLDAAARNGLALGHRYLFGFPQIANLRDETDRLPTAALISSAEDLAHFLIAQQNGGSYNGASVLSAAGMERMHQGTAQGDGFRYAMGWREGKVGDVDVISHGGVLPNYRGEMVMVPNGRWGVVVLTNISSMLPVVNTSHRIADNIAAMLGGTPLPEAGSGLKTTYLVISIVIGLLTLNQVKELVTPARWQMHMIERSRRAVIASVVGDLVFPIVLLIGLTVTVQVPWSEIVRSMPDVGYWMVLTIGLGLGLGVWKAVVAYRLIKEGVITSAPEGRR